MRMRIIMANAMKRLTSENDADTDGQNETHMVQLIMDLSNYK